jgi:hypothetical protein
VPTESSKLMGPLDNMRDYKTLSTIESPADSHGVAHAQWPAVPRPALDENRASPRPVIARSRFARRQSDPQYVRLRIAASQTLLAMTGCEGTGSTARAPAFLLVAPRRSNLPPHLLWIGLPRRKRSSQCQQCDSSQR